MPIPATLTSYLPALLKTTQVPDDLSYSTLPQGQVDYLSHEWREEDVWRSWRNMTRQKNAIANGMRLENASWRTWWKQRNKLKTVNPETLNWLKDSDVTWLYGPLHVGTDWQDYKAPKKPSPRKSSFSGTSKPSTPTGTKPILKRRSISQLLSLPASPLFDHDDTDTESEDEDGTERPKLLHTKSDTHISWRSRPHRKDSPPRIIAPELPQAHHDNTSTGSSASGTSDSSDSTGSEQDTTTTPSDAHQGDHPHPKKKHISFNTFVEQCIAIEKPKPKRKSFIADRNGLFHDAGYDDGYEEDSDVGYDYEEPSSFFLGEREQMGSDSDEDDDDVLEIRTSSSRSRSSSSSRSRHSPLSQANGPAYPSSMRTRPPLVRQSSTDRERMTIAPIPPTILKSTGVGNELADIPEDPKVSIPKEVELVYVPPSNSIYSLPSTPNIGAGSSTPGGPGGAEDVYHHRESYFSVGTSNNSRHTRSLSGGSVPSSSVLPHAVTSPVLPRTNSKTGLSQFFGHQPVTDEPMHIDSPPHAPAHENNESREGDAYDYFGGPGLGEDFPASDNRTRSYLGRRRRPSDSSDDNKDDELEERERERERQRVVRYSQGGAASVSTGRSSRFQIEGDDWSSSPRVPSVVVNEVAGAEEEREEESNSPLASRVPSSSNLNNADQQSSSSSTDTPSPQPSLVRTQSSSSLSSAGARPIAIKTTPVHESDGILAPYPISTSSNSGMSISFGTGPPLPSPIRQQNSSSSYQSDNYLSPTDSGPTRGRPPLLCPPGGPQSPSQTQVTTSHSGSSTTSYSYSTDSRSESRGRSSTRTSSFSSDLERERSGSGSGSCAREQERGRGRSGSRNGAGGGSSTSPIGSVSPSGSVIGIGSSYTGGAGSRGREREPMHHHSRGVSSRSSSYRSDDGRGDRERERERERERGDRERERGRDRSGRRLENSMSPPYAMGSPVRVASASGEDFPTSSTTVSTSTERRFQPYSPELLGASLEKYRSEEQQQRENKEEASTTRSASPLGSISGSSTASSSTVGGAATVIAAPNSSGAISSTTSTALPPAGSGSLGESDSSKSARPRLANIPSPIPEEEETRSRQPTPANSPVAAFRRTPSSSSTPTKSSSATPTANTSSSSSNSPASPTPKASPSSNVTSTSHMHSPPGHHRTSSKSSILQPVTSPSEATASPPLSPASIKSRWGSSGVNAHLGFGDISNSSNNNSNVSGGLGGDGELNHAQQTGTLVGRAAEIVSSARGFLGSIWNNSSG